MIENILESLNKYPQQTEPELRYSLKSIKTYFDEAINFLEKYNFIEIQNTRKHKIIRLKNNNQLNDPTLKNATEKSSL